MKVVTVATGGTLKKALSDLTKQAVRWTQRSEGQYVVGRNGTSFELIEKNPLDRYPFTVEVKRGVQSEIFAIPSIPKKWSVPQTPLIL